jgi:ribulose 1,5-bisphosphate synthetase/thiazole synthase
VPDQAQPACAAEQHVTFERKAMPHVIIIGCGFGGLAAARELATPMCASP